MSFWKRLLGRDEAPEEELEDAAEAEEGAPPLAPEDPELRLAALGASARADVDVEEVLRLIDRLGEEGREARAIDLARRVLAHRPDALPIHQRVAELLASRGDDEGADRLLAPFLDSASAPLELWMLGAEIAERRGAPERALALYERVVAQDLDYPRARARVRRLREGERKTQDLGATLMADGALTRGRYRVIRELGRGGAGTVFLADDLSLGRRVALKVYHRRGRAERIRLLVEARTPARLEHPGIVRIFDVDEALAAIVMERVLGASVRQELEKGRLPLKRVVRWIRTAAEALHHVHERGFVHRDFKPSNMLLRGDDRVVLTDFGVACEDGWSPLGAAAMGEGTLAYMPPEQRGGAPARATMDVYALGKSIQEIFGRTSAAVPPALDGVVAACLRNEPRQRPNAAWVAEQLE